MAPAPPPFSRMLLPYDGSEPARAALQLAIAIAHLDVRLIITTVVDETALIADSANTMVAYDPSPLMEELDAQAHSQLDEAAAQCRAAGVSPAVHVVHDRPVNGILSSADRHGCDLIVMGTHARTGVARTFLGSTTESVLRLSPVPILTVRTVDSIAPSPFASAIVAIDDSEPADAAAVVAARLARAGTSLTACYAVDTTQLYEDAVSLGFDPEPVARDMRAGAEAVMRSTLERVGILAQTKLTVVEGEAVGAILLTAKERHATLIICGTHGRRGVRRFLLGSVAEHLVRTSEVPVLVVPVPHKS
jgi:nucleotide-binding universal stress UspA family protein